MRTWLTSFSIFLAFLFIGPGLSLAQSSAELEKAYRQYQAFEKQGRYAQAIPLVERALELGEQELGADHKRVRSIRSHLATLYFRQRQHDKAERILQRALAFAREDKSGRKWTRVGTIQARRALNFEIQKLFEEAEQALLRDKFNYITYTRLNRPKWPAFLRPMLIRRAIHADKQGRNNNAARLYDAARTVTANELGGKHRLVGQLLKKQAELYLKDKKTEYRAVKYLKALIPFIQKEVGAEAPQMARYYLRLAGLEWRNKEYLQAAWKYRDAAKILGKIKGDHHRDVIAARELSSDAYVRDRRFLSGAKEYGRALESARLTYQPGDKVILRLLGKQGRAYDRLLAFAKAERSYRQLLGELQDKFGKDHEGLIPTKIKLAGLYLKLQRFKKAERFYAGVLGEVRASLKPTQRLNGKLTGRLGQAILGQGDARRARPYIEKGLLLAKAAFGEQHPGYFSLLDDRGRLEHAEERYGVAEDTFRLAIDLAGKYMNKHKKRFTKKNNRFGLFYDFAAIRGLAELYRQTGRYAQAEELLQALAARAEKIFKGRRNFVGEHARADLTAVLIDQGRYDEAGQYVEAVGTGMKTAYGTDHPWAARIAVQKGRIALNQDRLDDASNELLWAVAIFQRILSENHPTTGLALISLGDVYQRQGNPGEAASIYRRALRILERHDGGRPGGVAGALIRLGNALIETNRIKQAATFLERAFKILDSSANGDRRLLARATEGLARVELAKGEGYNAFFEFRDAIALRRTLEKSLARNAETLGKVRSRNMRLAEGLAAAAIRSLDEPGSDRSALMNETFIAAQWALRTSASTALAQAALRSAVTDPKLRGLIRERSDLIRQWDRLSRSLTAYAVDKKAAHTRLRNSTKERIYALHEERDKKLPAQLAELEAQLAKEFPDFAARQADNALSIPAIQKELTDDDAFLFILPGREKSYLWAVTKNDARWVRLNVDAADLDRRVTVLRAGLDPSGPTRFAARKRGFAPATKQTRRITTEKERFPFDLAAAHDLYRVLLKPVEDILISRKHLYIVPSGALSSLPFHVLVSEAPDRDLTGTARYRFAAWLVRRWAITILPSVSALRVLRNRPGRARASRAYLAYGDPLLAGKGAKRKGRFGWSERISWLNGIYANTDAIRQLAPLPDTADEMRAVANSLGVPESQLRIGKAAVEAAITQANADDNLKNYRILHFATHGLVPGDLPGLAEPALVLTPPPRYKARVEDDGLLMASEVSQLKLNADWVILSACNTAAGDKSDAEGLSGLASAFLYAGARTLMVSHWPVYSNAAVKLITGTFAKMREDPAIGRAEALRRSMLALMNEPGAGRAHPSFWAPFIVVGEGARQ